MSPLHVGLLAVAGVVLAGLLALAGGYVLHARSLTQWVRADIDELEPLPHVLVEHGEPHLEALQNPKDRALLNHTVMGRDVIELTRSEFRSGFLGRGRWVKVVLVTARPGDQDVELRLKLLHRLERDPRGLWHVVRVEELALP